MLSAPVPTCPSFHLKNTSWFGNTDGVGDITPLSIFKPSTVAELSNDIKAVLKGCVVPPPPNIIVPLETSSVPVTVSYTHLRAHET